MINWTNLAANALWILGLSLALATLSHASWRASAQHQRLRERLKRSSVTIPLNLAGLFFSMGLAATSDRALEIALWLVLVAAFTVQTVLLILHRRRQDAI
jgi:hypothetical protein